MSRAVDWGNNTCVFELILVAVADVFKIAAGTKTAAPPGSSANSRPATVRSDSREALKQALGAHPHPHTLELLRTEVDTMGEDWLLALQDELTKPYFLTVRSARIARTVLAGSSARGSPHADARGS